MTMPSDRPSAQLKDLFYYLLVLTGFFILLEVSFFIQCNRGYLSDYEFMTSNIVIPWTILPDIAYFIAMQLLVHAAYTVVIWLTTAGLVTRFSTLRQHTIAVGLTLWLFGLFCVIAANQMMYPNSKFAELSGLVLNATSTKAVALLGAILFGSLVGTVLLSRLRYLAVTLALSLPLLLIYTLLPVTTVKDAASQQTPNIILIGIDSLRPDHIGFMGSPLSTPFLDQFLEHSTVFGEAITPLARTFPSWMSLLLGEYPRNSGIRTNLVERERVNTRQTLPSLLKEKGYRTVYASDETRFSNMDRQYGFDEIVTPPMGVNDFLLGAFNDFPLSNLLLNTKFGSILFPYSYANRPVFFAYEPDSFLKMITPTLVSTRDQPLFLAIHFCLPHYPYLWRTLPGQHSEPVQRYGLSIERQDQQLQQLFQLLQKGQLLDHAIVIILSDHGEALELSGDRITEADLYMGSANRKPPQFYPDSVDDMKINQTVGHGTDVLSINQYHTVLAFKLYGLGDQYQGIVPGAVSLLAIKPTVMAAIGEGSKSPDNLLPVIRGIHSPTVEKQHIFIESDFTPEAIRTVYPKLKDVVLEGIQIFQIDPVTTRLTVKKDMQEKIVRSKQYADIYGEWMLALYPQPDGSRMPILVNLVTGNWTDNLDSVFAINSPASRMLLALRQFYGTEIGKISATQSA